MNKKTMTLIVNILIAVLVPYAWLKMFISADGTLSASGFASLRFFTVLSNLLEGSASVVYTLFLLKKNVPAWAKRLKLIAAACVGLTFLTVLLFLGPVFGFSSMYRGANFWLHLIVPLLALIEFSFLDGGAPMTKRDSLLAVAPMLLYGLCYLVNILINGRGEAPNWNDFYGFTIWGMPAAIGIFAALGLITWGTATVIRKLNTKFACQNESVTP